VHNRPQAVFNVRAFEGNGLQVSRTFIGILTAEGFKSTIALTITYKTHTHSAIEMPVTVV